MNSRSPNSVSHDEIGCADWRSDIAERLGAVGVDLDPEHVEVRDRAQYFQIAFGLGVEIEIEHEIDVRPSAVVERLEVHAQIPQHLLVDVELGIERPPEARAPALRPAVLVHEDVGLERAKTLLAHLAADRLDAVEVSDRWLPVGMVDAPRGAVRPVEPDAVALLAAEPARSTARRAAWPWRRAARSRSPPSPPRPRRPPPAG